MRRRLSVLMRFGLGLLLVALLSACAAPPPSSPSGTQSSGPAGQSPASSAPARQKTIVIGITSSVPAFGALGALTTAGGWLSLSEVHSDGLITSDVQTRNPVGRLAEKVPTLDDGSITLLPDGKMRVVYNLRKNIVWQDGVPFTAKDVVFTYKFNSDKGLPTVAITGASRSLLERIESVEAPDDYTAVMNFNGPFYQAGGLGVRTYWMEPVHILAAPYAKYLESKNPDDVANLPYWTSEYVHLGAFRLTEFDPNTGMTFQANEKYFLGKPKVDTVRVQAFADPNTLYASLLSGAVDLFPEISLKPELGLQLKQQWDSTHQGSVYVKEGNTWFIAPQVRPSVQMEQAVLDPNVRAALYRALDRDTLADGLLSGHKELAAYSLLPASDALYDVTKDALRQYSYDPNRAAAGLRDAGWTLGADGTLHNATDNRPFKSALWTTSGTDRDIAAFADYWRKVGLQVDEFIVPAAQTRNAEYRAGYPGFEFSAQGNNDAILGRMDGPAASAANRWVGNRGGYEDPKAADLMARYRSSLTLNDQRTAMKNLSDFVAAELPLLLIYYVPEIVGVRAGFKALDDVSGGEEAAQYFGTFTRNAYMWDVQ